MWEDIFPDGLENIPQIILPECQWLASGKLLLAFLLLINLPNPLTCIAGASSNSDAESESKALLTLVSSDCDLFSVDLEIMHLHTQHWHMLPYVLQVHKHTLIN